LDRRLSLDELAGQAGFSPYHFHRIFSGMLGESVAGHIRRLRLERAAVRLKTTRLSVIEIAHEAGYGTHESFTRAFRAAFDTSPQGFRRRHRPVLQLAAASDIHFTRTGRPRTPARLITTAAGDDVAPTVHIHELDSMRVAFVRHVGPYRDVGRAWDRLLTVLGKDGCLGGESRFFGICHDDPDVTRPAAVRYDACANVDASFAAQGDIGVQTIAGGRYATLTHIGPYTRLAASYRRLFGGWLPQSGERLRPLPCLEQYLNSPESTDPADLLVDIHAPLE
jgi:AraC family transcriptional regulator